MVSVSSVAEPLKNMDNEGSPVSTKCFGISLIVKEIMKHGSNMDLLNLSMVNRLCNYEARSMMRDRGCFTARLKSRNPCQDLPGLASLIENMNVVPFGGISVDLNATHDDACGELSSTSKIASIHGKILDQLPWKSLSITYSGYWPVNINCSAFSLVIKVLQEFCGNLEELSLHVEPFAVYSLVKVIRDSKFPRLRTLRYEADAGHRYFDVAHGDFIHAVVSRAGQGRPVRLHLNEYIPHMERALEGGSVELVADYDFNSSI